MLAAAATAGSYTTSYAVATNTGQSNFTYTQFSWVPGSVGDKIQTVQYIRNYSLKCTEMANRCIVK
jgi:hypothetical protein